MSTKRPSNLPYAITAVAALGIIVTAWLGRDWIAERSVRIGVEAPNFEATRLDGTPASLADYEGKVVLLNIWATWCAPCRVEMPSMERLYKTIDDDDFEIVAVSIDAPVGGFDLFGRPGGDIQSFADSLSLTFPILHDPDGRIQQTYRTTGVPESFVIGRDGLIHRVVSGETEWDHPEPITLVQRLLDAEPE